MLSSVVRAAVLPLVCLLLVLGATSAAQAQLDNPLDSDDKRLDKLPFRNSSLSFGQSLSTNSFFRNTQQSYNPSYLWGFSLYLSWHFDDQTSLALEQGLALELTDADSTLERQRPLLTDTRLIFDRELYAQKINDASSWALHGAASLYAPLSLASRASTMVLATGLTFSAGLSLPKVLEGMAINARVGYLHRFLRSNMMEIDQPYPCFAGGSSRELCSQLGGTSNTRNAFRAGVSSQLALNDKWGVYLSALHIWSRGADLADALFVSDSGGIEPLRGGSDGHWRNTNELEVGVSYALLAWLGLGASVSNTFSERGPAGEIREPFRLSETYLGLDATLKLDELYLATRGPAR